MSAAPKRKLERRGGVKNQQITFGFLACHGIKSNDINRFRQASTKATLTAIATWQRLFGLSP
jgi:hypothetical protein